MSNWYNIWKTPSSEEAGVSIVATEALEFEVPGTFPRFEISVARPQPGFCQAKCDAGVEVKAAIHLEAEL